MEDKLVYAEEAEKCGVSLGQWVRDTLDRVVAEELRPELSDSGEGLPDELAAEDEGWTEEDDKELDEPEPESRMVMTEEGPSYSGQAREVEEGEGDWTDQPCPICGRLVQQHREDELEKCTKAAHVLKVTARKDREKARKERKWEDALTDAKHEKTFDPDADPDCPF